MRKEGRRWLRSVVWSTRIRFWLRALDFVLYGLRLSTKSSSVAACANRHTTTCRAGSVEVTVMVRDTSRPDGYSREELVEMLRLVREQELLQGWRVPERGR